MKITKQPQPPTFALVLTEKELIAIKEALRFDYYNRHSEDVVLETRRLQDNLWEQINEITEG